MTEKPTLLERARSGESLSGVFVFDAHQHLGGWHQFHMPVSDAAGALRIMDRIGIDAACTSATVAALGPEFHRGNDTVIAAVRRHPGRFFGYIVVNPNDPEGAAVEVERCAKEGLRAIKIHSYHGKSYDAAEYRSAYEIANSRGWPVLAHTWGGDDLVLIDRLAEEYPGITWLLGHAGATDPEGYCKLSRRRDNVFLETSSSACDWNLIETLVAGAGAEKLLFGSDMVFLTATQQIGNILFARISDREKELILGLNARHVFSLPEA